MKICFIQLLLVSLFLSACNTPEEKRITSIQSLLADKIERTSQIEIIDLSYDSVYSTQRNIDNLTKMQEIIIMRDSIVQELNNFKTRFADNNNRVWLRDMSDDLRSSFDTIRNNADRMYSLINNLGMKCNSDPMIGKDQSSVFLKYKSNGTIKYGLFIFNDNDTITQYKIFSEEDYFSIEEFINQAKKDATKYIPYFETVGVDIVPEDEDPSQTREERAEINAIQKQLAENKKEKVIVPRFYILKREREDYNDYTPRTRFHIKTPKLYTESDLDIIADSIQRKERTENGISEIWVNYYLPNKKIHYSNSYGLSVRLRTERSSNIFQREEKKHGYNPPKARDLSNENIRIKQLWGAFDQGQIAGYEAGYNDGKKRRRAFYSFDSYYPTSDEWIEQSYKQGYEVGYLDGFDDAGGSR